MAHVRRTTSFAWRYARWIRFGVAGLLTLLALITWTRSDSPPPQVPVTVAAREIASGSQIAAEDLTTEGSTLPLDTPPVDQLVGETVRGPVAAGEPVTRSRLAPGRAVEPAPGSVVFPLTLADERIAGLLNSGDRVDVLVAPDSLHEGQPRVIAQDIEVLAVPATRYEFTRSIGQAGAVVLLALPEEQATDLASVRRSDHVTVTMRGHAA